MTTRKHTATAAEFTIADDFTHEEIAAHLASSSENLVNIEALWPGLVSLASEDRSGNLGKLIAQLAPSLRLLFSAITPAKGEAPAKTASKAKLAAIFNSTLGNQDQGKDASVFEVDLLERRLTRIEAQLDLIDRIDKLRKAFTDDVLNTGTMVIDPGLKALEMARTLAASSDEFRSLLAPLLNTLGDMTKPARQAQAEARAKAKAKAAEAAAATGTPGTATKG